MITYSWTPLSEDSTALLEQVCALHNAEARTHVGDAASLLTPRALLASAASPDMEIRVLVASEDGQVLGSAEVWAPLLENRQLGVVDLVVAPERRREGIGTALATEALAECQRMGRTTIDSYTSHRQDTLVPGGDTVNAGDEADGETQPAASISVPETTWRLPAEDPSVAFARSWGFRPALMERVSTLELFSPAADEFLAATPSSAPEGYRTVTYEDAAPEEHAEALCTLLSIFADDIPVGEATTESEIWTPERLRRTEERLRSQGRTTVDTLIIHEATGAVAAQTSYAWKKEQPHLVQQRGTVVAREHRGRGLGAIVKRANLAAARAAWPEGRVIVTENSDHNVHMLRINSAMGFAAAAADVAWRRTLDEERG
ncbi:GNAT family N-acetyltransferase [Falsarthrobacter nasiphocae]|uniref:GNAT superfamily N-acetyltransferase n=1 Tax=Falsarthrobacter nasiphocae TaxID=189863 RepID=A0AAE4C6K8_9MICC|nr:GNAT family N-acetyltransferase [Falsarthrobacter nasiphocae]MDR6892267.1 GNAT superfamily N-acetyltransferase [Falsarthrobacter nasiphocae]